jgi:hypothetical protein
MIMVPDSVSLRKRMAYASPWPPHARFEMTGSAAGNYGVRRLYRNDYAAG